MTNGHGRGNKPKQKQLENRIKDHRFKQSFNFCWTFLILNIFFLSYFFKPSQFWFIILVISFFFLFFFWSHILTWLRCRIRTKTNLIKWNFHRKGKSLVLKPSNRFNYVQRFRRDYHLVLPKKYFVNEKKLSVRSRNYPALSIKAHVGLANKWKRK